jgi:hypothetical protein
MQSFKKTWKNAKAIPEQAMETHTVVRHQGSHFLDKQLTDGSEVVNFMHWLPFTPREIPGTHFC